MQIDDVSQCSSPHSHLILSLTVPNANLNPSRLSFHCWNENVWVSQNALGHPDKLCKYWASANLSITARTVLKLGAMSQSSNQHVFSNLGRIATAIDRSKGMQKTPRPLINSESCWSSRQRSEPGLDNSEDRSHDCKHSIGCLG